MADRDDMLKVVAGSVAARRAMSGATGIPESPPVPRPAPQIALLPDPYLTDAEYFARRQRQPGPHVGKAPVLVDRLDLIGGLARLGGATEAQEAAAARYRMIHERAQLGGAKAIDYTKAKVDTSGQSESAVIEIGAAARAEYSAVVRRLGMIRSNLVERVVVYDVPISAMARGGRARDRLKRELFAVLDELAVFFRLAPPPRRSAS